jgi:hypothetical protein
VPRRSLVCKGVSVHLHLVQLPADHRELILQCCTHQ